jgi:hypothetical protein
VGDVIRPLLLAAGTGALALQGLHARRNWGATANEAAGALPGDELVPEPAEQTTLAVTVEAPADDIWAWLVQMGQDRGGMYSYDWLENLIGLDIHTTDEIREEWQQLAAGDRIVVVPEGYGPMPAGYFFRVARVDPPRTLLLRQAPPEHPWNGVWSFHIVPTGTGRCRLLSRMRTERVPQAWLRIVTRMGEPVTLVMTRRMLHGIRQRSEGRAAGDRPSGGPALP